MFIGEISSQSEEKRRDEKSHWWGVILAGGEGNRLQSYVEKIYGYPRPKQYCVLTGKRSLLEHTFDRASKSISPEQIILLANRNHSSYVTEERFQKIKKIVYQPCGRETTAGILLPVSKVYHQDPDAIVSIFPSDQFIEQESLFMHYIEDANRFVLKNPDSIVMLGIHTNKPESGCGWIEPGESIIFKAGRTIRKVKRFWEKPDSNLLYSLWNSGCLCNTFVLVGKASAFINHIKKHTPSIYKTFDVIKKSFGTPLEPLVVQNVFPRIPMKNFSQEVLEKITNQLFVLEVKGVNWSDWGEEQRVTRDIDRLNKLRTQKCVTTKNDSEKKRKYPSSTIRRNSAAYHTV